MNKRQIWSGVALVSTATLVVLGLLTGGLAANAAEAPTPSPSSNSGSSSAGSQGATAAVADYLQALASYQQANAAYLAFKPDTSAPAKSNQALLAAFQGAQKAYAKASASYVQAVRQVSSSFANEVAAASKAARQTGKNAQTAEQKNSVNASLASAITGATARRDALLNQLTKLGDPPARPNLQQVAVSQNQSGKSNQSGKNSQGSSGQGSSGSGASSVPSFTQNEDSSQESDPVVLPVPSKKKRD